MNNESIDYKGFKISGSTMQVPASMEWSVRVTIYEPRDSQVFHHSFDATNTFSDRDDAIRYCIQFGKDIIDGQYPNLTWEELLSLQEKWQASANKG